MGTKIVITLFLAALINYIIFILISRNIHTKKKEVNDIVQIEIVIQDNVNFNDMHELEIFTFGQHFLKKSIENRRKFDEYLTKFHKSYSGETYNKKLRNFLKSMEEIKKINSTFNNTAVYGPTKFSDLSQEEFSARLIKVDDDYNCFDTLKTCSTYLTRPSRNIYVADAIPPKFDWRSRGIITYVVDQLMCAGCWAISTVETVEAMAALKRISNSPLSKQELIDCSWISNGCNGGNVYSALDFLCDTQLPLTTEKKYPSTFEPEKCQGRPSHGVRLKQFQRKCNINEQDLLHVIATHGPVIALVNAYTWKNYVGGVINMNCDNEVTSLDHAIQIVGYDLTTPEPYYIVKNSWGKEYGHEGYVYVAVGKNVCGIAREVFYIDV